MGNVAGLYKTYVIAVDAANCTLAKAMAADAQTAANEFATAHQAATIKLTKYGAQSAVDSAAAKLSYDGKQPDSAYSGAGVAAPACWTAWPRTSRATPM